MSLAEQRLARFREWVQFVYLGGGPNTLSDDELMLAVARVHDADEAAAREEAFAECAEHGCAWCSERIKKTQPELVEQ